VQINLSILWIRRIQWRVCTVDKQNVGTGAFWQTVRCRTVKSWSWTVNRIFVETKLESIIIIYNFVAGDPLVKHSSKGCLHYWLKSKLGRCDVLIHIEIRALQTEHLHLIVVFGYCHHRVGKVHKSSRCTHWQHPNGGWRWIIAVYFSYQAQTRIVANVILV